MEEMADYSSAMGYFERGRWISVQFTCPLGTKAIMKSRVEIFLCSYRGNGAAGCHEILLLLQWSAN